MGIHIHRQLRLPPGIAPDRKNIFDVALPYGLLCQAQAMNSEGKKWVVFWGVPFQRLDMVYADLPEFIRRTNQCLEYIRRQCAGYELIYKPHPNETDEASFLDLKGFRVMPEKTVAEFFILKHFPKIQHVFSTYSSAAMTAAKMGLDAHIFLPYIQDTLTQANREGNEAYFKYMPTPFFIHDLERSFQEHRIRIADTPDPVLVSNLIELLAQGHRGIAWFVLGDPGSLTSVISMSRLVRRISPTTKTGLIVERHHRWNVMNMDEVRNFFDTMLVYPRWIASLRPGKIGQQIRTARAVRQAPIARGDVFLGFNYTSFLENCLMSYFPDVPRAAFMKKETLEFCYGPKDSSFFRVYFARIGNIFFEKVMQPLLGLKRTVFLEDPVRVANFDRYVRPINEVYNQVYVY